MDGIRVELSPLELPAEQGFHAPDDEKADGQEHRRQHELTDSNLVTVSEADQREFPDLGEIRRVMPDKAS